MRQARARSDLGQLLQERLRGLHPDEVAPQAFQLLIQHVKTILPGVQAVVLGQGYLGHDLLLVQEEGAPTLLGQAALKLFGALPPGRSRVQAISDWIYRNVDYRTGASDSTTVPTLAL